MRGATAAGVGAGIAILAAGVAGFVLFLLARLSAFSASLERFGAPGEAVLDLRAGPHTVYWEGPGLRPAWPGFDCTLVSERAGTRVPLSESWVPSRYSFEGRRGVSVYSFDVRVPGAYRFRAAAPAGKEAPRGTMAVRRGGWGEIVVTVGGCLLLLGGSIGAGVLLLVRSLVRASPTR
jgi:hypothetical protein